MIHYHGGPITPDEVAVSVWKSRHAFVSFAHKGQLQIAMDVCQSFAIDNGAFSFWRSGKEINWEEYYSFVDEIINHPRFDFAIIPDIIDGTEEENDKQLNIWPFDKFHSAPVWHLHESIDRLISLTNNYPRVALGSSGKYATVGDDKWKYRMDIVFDAITEDGYPLAKIHGLRMLNPMVFSLYPFSSVDSTNIARNIGIDKKWKGTYPPASKRARAMVMVDRIESQTSPNKFNRGLQWEMFV